MYQCLFVYVICNIIIHILCVIVIMFICICIYIYIYMYIYIYIHIIVMFVYIYIHIMLRRSADGEDLDPPLLLEGPNSYYYRSVAIINNSY